MKLYYIAQKIQINDFFCVEEEGVVLYLSYPYEVGGGVCIETWGPRGNMNV